MRGRRGRAVTGVDTAQAARGARTVSVLYSIGNGTPKSYSMHGHRHRAPVWQVHHIAALTNDSRRYIAPSAILGSVHEPLTRHFSSLLTQSIMSGSPLVRVASRRSSQSRG